MKLWPTKRYIVLNPTPGPPELEALEEALAAALDDPVVPTEAFVACLEQQLAEAMAGETARVQRQRSEQRQLLNWMGGGIVVGGLFMWWLWHNHQRHGGSAAPQPGLLAWLIPSPVSRAVPRI